MYSNVIVTLKSVANTSCDLPLSSQWPEPARYSSYAVFSLLRQVPGPVCADLRATGGGGDAQLPARGSSWLSGQPAARPAAIACPGAGATLTGKTANALGEIVGASDFTSAKEQRTVEQALRPGEPVKEMRLSAPV